MMKRFLAFLSALIFCGPALAQAPTWSEIVGGFPAWYGAPTFNSNAYTLAAPLPTQPAWSLVNQQHVRIAVPTSGTNTGAATLNVNSTGALPIVANTQSGLSALVGGELVAGLVYDLTYSTSAASACASSCYVLSWVAGGTVAAGTSQTVTTAQWVAGTIFTVTTASQIITLPVSSGLSPNGGLMVMTIGNSVTLTPNAADAINGGSAGASIAIPANTTVLVVKSSAGNISVTPTGIAHLDLADQTMSGGANITSSNLGTKSSGTLTIDCGASPLQYVTNGGTFTLAAPANDGSCLVLITNGASAGVITPSGFTVGSTAGDCVLSSCGTVNGNKFTVDIWRINGVSGYRVAAHQ